MSHRIYRSCNEPQRQDLSWDDRWKGADKGLITCWEVGRKLSEKEPELAIRAKKGELPVLGWKGGVEKILKKKKKIGTLFYLAQLQGLRGVDLDIDLTKEYTMTCARTSVTVTFTGDYNKYANA